MSDDDPFDGAWECPRCGAGEPHDAIYFPQEDRRGVDAEVEVDVTCESVYFTPVGGDGRGFAFTSAEFEQVIDHYQTARDDDE